MLRTKNSYSITEITGLIFPCTYKSSFAVDGNGSNDTPFTIPIMQLQATDVCGIVCRLN